MGALKLAEIFGEKVVFDNRKKTITFFLEDLSNQGLLATQITEDNIEDCSSKILWALLYNAKDNQAETNNDPSVPIFIQAQGKRNAVRNNTPQIAYQLLIFGYRNDPIDLEIKAGFLGE